MRWGQAFISFISSTGIQTYLDKSLSNFWFPASAGTSLDSSGACAHESGYGHDQKERKTYKGLTPLNYRFIEKNVVRYLTFWLPEVRNGRD